MSRLPLVDPSQAQGKNHELFTAVKAQMGRVPNLIKVMANSPAVLEGYLGFSGGLAHGTLDPKIRERIAIEVAESNGCGYCLAGSQPPGQMSWPRRRGAPGEPPWAFARPQGKRRPALRPSPRRKAWRGQRARSATG